MSPSGLLLIRGCSSGRFYPSAGCTRSGGRWPVRRYHSSGSSSVCLPVRDTSYKSRNFPINYKTFRMQSNGLFWRQGLQKSNFLYKKIKTSQGRRRSPAGGLPSSKTAHYEDGRPKNRSPSSNQAPSEDGRAAAASPGGQWTRFRKAVRVKNLPLRSIPPKARALGPSRSHGHGRPWVFHAYRLPEASAASNRQQPSPTGTGCLP